MKKCEDNYIIPNELQDEDVFCLYYIFDDENEMVEYVTKTYDVNRECLMKELYGEESMRKEFGKENYLRNATIINGEIYVRELLSGKYILWETY